MFLDEGDFLDMIYIDYSFSTQTSELEGEDGRTRDCKRLCVGSDGRKRDCYCSWV